MVALIAVPVALTYWVPPSSNPTSTDVPPEPPEANKLKCATAANQPADVGAAGDNLASGHDRQTADDTVRQNDFRAAADRDVAAEPAGFDDL